MERCLVVQKLRQFQSEWSVPTWQAGWNVLVQLAKFMERLEEVRDEDASRGRLKFCVR